MGTSERPQPAPGYVPVPPPLFDVNRASGDEGLDRLARAVLESAFEVHRTLGSGLLQSTYEACLAYELAFRGLPFERRKTLALCYKGEALAQSDEVNLVVDNILVVQPLAWGAILPVHEAQLLSQLRLGAWPLGLLIDFGGVRLGEGIRRLVLSRHSK